MDEQFRGAGRAARTEIESTVDVDAAWREMSARIAAVDEPSMIRPIGARRPDRARRWIVVVAAAASVALVVGVAVLLSRPDTVRTDVPTTDASTIAPQPVEPEPSAPASTAPAATAPVSTSPTTVAPTTPPPSIVDVEVSYLDPPAVATVRLLGSDSLPSDQLAAAQYAIGEFGAVRVSSGAARVFANDGSQRDLTLNVNGLVSPVYGPLDVLYGLRPITEPTFGMELVAVGLSGPRAGEVVATSESLGAATYVELPTVALGHGPGGVTDLTRDRGLELLEYVDEIGEPTAWPGAPTAAPLFDDSGLLRMGDSAWRLDIQRDPTSTSPLTGDGGAAIGPGGVIVHPTTIGGALDPTADESGNAMPVVAVLPPDGPGHWLSVPDGWSVSSISPWGVLVTRPDPTLGVVELGLLDLRPPPVDPLVAFATEPAPVDIVCDPGTVCVQFDVDASGVVTSSRFDTDEVVRWTDPPVIASPGLGQVSLIAIGPDDVAYLAPFGTDESGVDVVAVSLAAADAGREIRRWPDVLGISGDNQLIPTPSGLVEVACCGPDQVRPDPDAAVALPWVSQDGAEITADIPTVRWNVTTTTVTIDDRSWRPDLTDLEGRRGMPLITPTADGGFLGAFDAIDGGSTVIVRGHPDGTSEQVRVTSYRALLHPDGSVWFLDPATGRLVVTAPFAD